MTKDQAIYFRNQLRAARAVALQDAEGFHEILYATERLGSFLTPPPPEKSGGKTSNNNLDAYKKGIEDYIGNSGSPLVSGLLTGWHIPFSKLYEVVRIARNDAMHQGAFARHLTMHTVQLSLILEDALMSNPIDLPNNVGDYMVRDPACASEWQPVSFIRQQLLVNSFSYLPIKISENWQLVSDNSIMIYLRASQPQTQNGRKKRLNKPLSDAIADGLKLEDVYLCCQDDPLDEVIKEMERDGKPVLIVRERKSKELLGILTPFDLL